MIHVFLKNKIISTDAIVPLLLDARRQGLARPIVFYVQSAETLAVLKNNYVLWEGLTSLGRVELAVSQNRSLLARALHRVSALKWLSGLAIDLLRGRARIVHFGQLYNALPYRLVIGVKPTSVLLVEGAFAGFSQVQEAFARLKATRDEGPDLAAAPVIAVFEQDSDLAKRARERGTEPFVVGAPHLLTGWSEFVDRVAKRDVKDENPIVFVLGYFGPLEFMRSGESTKELFFETLDVLDAESGGRPVLVKPHSISDMNVVQQGLQSRRHVRLTNAHPAVLAKRASFFIANYYSTALSTVAALGGTTVEYTDYSDDALRLSNGGSTRADAITHFLTRDKAKLVELVRNLVEAGRPALVERSHPAPGTLIRWLAS